MKKTAIYTVLAILIGFLGGYLIFHDNHDDKQGHETEDHEVHENWTCSMHPQIMLPEPGDCPICGMDLIPAGDMDGGLSAESFKMTKNAIALANIETSVVGTGIMDGGLIRLSGKITVNEKAQAVQASYFDGRIEKLFVNTTGENIRKGQRLATIYSPELVSAQQELLTASGLKETQPSLYLAVRNKLKLWKLTDDQIDAIESSGQVNEYFPVYSTVSGTVTDKLTEEGDYVKKGQPLFKIVNLSSLWAEFDAYENQLYLLKKDMPLTISSRSFPNKRFVARISFIDPVLNTATRTVIVRANLNNKDMLLKPGMFVEGIIEADGVKDSSIQIPATAVMWTGKRSVVYVKTSPTEPIFEMREVQIADATGETYAVLDGLKAGEEIVTRGTFTVDATAQLQGKKSMMNKEGGDTNTGHEGHMNMRIDSHDKTNSDHQEHTSVELSQQAKNNFNILLKDYIDLKDALVQDDFKSVKSSSNTIKNDLAKFTAFGENDAQAFSAWEKTGKQLMASAQRLTESEDISSVRNEFKVFSKLMTGSVELFGSDMAVYSQYCPMADNNNGAYWLSFEEEIRNPYFGDSMLTCGELVSNLGNNGD